MNRYFIEVCYKGNAYSGFQVQLNAVTIQSELEKALKIFLRREITLTGSSRTDAGVHARQNYFHFDGEEEIREESAYNLNALLPEDISVLSIRKVFPGAHCRFDALSRRYRYVVYKEKNPFLQGRGYFFPYGVDLEAMEAAAKVVMEFEDFSAFAKRNSQVKTHLCRILASGWREEAGCLVYEVEANRFLRGMVRGLVGTMLQVGRNRITVADFREIVSSGNSSRADFSVPGHGLYLEKVVFKEGYFG